MSGGDTRAPGATPASADDDRRARGLKMYASQFGLPEDEIAEHMTQLLGPLMAEEAWQAGAGAWSDRDLSMRDRSLIVIASMVTQGGVDQRLRGHLRWALDNGVTRAELDALMALLAVYIGYPRASTGMETLRNELGPR
jgi:alkylhydroperoxidase/carboxymuconolactone decarboxylase family protein YurZ